jgi:hypothetical protein
MAVVVRASVFESFFKLFTVKTLTKEALLLENELQELTTAKDTTTLIGPQVPASHREMIERTVSVQSYLWSWYNTCCAPCYFVQHQKYSLMLIQDLGITIVGLLHMQVQSTLCQTP